MEKEEKDVRKVVLNGRRKREKKIKSEDKVKEKGIKS